MAVGPRVLEVVGVPGPGRLSRLREWWEQEHVFGYGLIVPAIALLVTLVAFPFGMAIYFSLSDYWVGSPGGWVGLQNYRDILANETFRQTVQNSFVFTGIALSLFGKSLPPGGSFDIFVFGDPDPAAGASSLGWYGAYKKNQPIAP